MFLYNSIFREFHGEQSTFSRDYKIYLYLFEFHEFFTGNVLASTFSLYNRNISVFFPAFINIEINTVGTMYKRAGCADLNSLRNFKSMTSS
jgi:hypothetical protein